MGYPKASKLLFVVGLWCVHKLHKQFSTLYRSKIVIFAKHFFDIVTTYNDEICYVKHVLAPLYVFFTLFGCLGGLPRGLFSVLLAALQRRPVLYHTRWLLAVHWHCSSGHRGQLAPTTHPQCRLVSNPCPAGREVVSYSILRGAMAPWLAQRRLRISACAPSVRQLNKSLLLCVWRIPLLLPTLHAHAAHTFMPTCFRLPHMGRTLAAPVVLWLCNT